MYDNSYVGASSGNMISCLGVFCLCCPLSVPSDQLLLEILVLFSMRLILLNFVLYRFVILNVLNNLQLFFLVFVFFLHVMFPSLKYIFSIDCTYCSFLFFLLLLRCLLLSHIYFLSTHLHSDEWVWFCFLLPSIIFISTVIILLLCIFVDLSLFLFYCLCWLI